jgi:hypothetical protein
MLLPSRFRHFRENGYANGKQDTFFLCALGAVFQSALLRAQTPSPAAPAFVTNNVYVAPLASETLHNNRDNIVIGVHGWTSYPQLWWRDGTNSWNNPNAEPPNPGMGTTIQEALGANANKWDSWGLDWTQGAAGGGTAPSTANEINAQLQGQYIAYQVLTNGNYKFIHLMGHSLGARVIETAANIIKQVNPNIVIQTTFFDAYQPYNWGLVFGSSANYSDQYYTTLDNFSGYLTSGQFPNALNVNMDSQVPPRPADYNFSTNALNNEYWIHNSPHFWYKATARDSANAMYGGYGFALSKESGNTWPPNNPKFAMGQNVTLNADGSTTSTQLRPVVDVAASKANLGLLNSAITGSANTIIDETANTASISAYASTATTPVGYVNFAITLTQPANYFQFNYKWLDLLDGTGRLTFNVYSLTGGGFDLKQPFNSLLWATDSTTGFTDTTLSTGKIIWTGTDFFNNPTTLPLPAGSYELRFRLDDLAGTQTSIQIGNIQTGLLAVPEPSSALLVLTIGLVMLTARPRRAKTPMAA